MMIADSAFFSWLKRWRLPILLVLLFFILRLPGISMPFHQDEWKNVSTAATAAGAGTFFAHPPLFEMIFVAAHAIFGEGYFRLLPLLFSIAGGVLLYLIMKRRFDATAAAWAVFLYALCFYNVLGSLMTDVDGSVLPFFFLLVVYAYDRWLDSPKGAGGKWFALLAVAGLLGFLVKLNFILVIGAVALDYAWKMRRDMTVKKIFSAGSVLGGFVILYAALLHLIQAIYPAFSIDFMLHHAQSFAGQGRNYTQIAVQALKAIFYLSPLIIVPLLFVSKEIWSKTRIFWIYLVLGGFFYFIAFDFSRGALDKYLMFLIIPLVCLVAPIFADALNRNGANTKMRNVSIIMGIVIAGIILLVNFLPHSVAALYPKTEWFSRVLHGQWAVLMPLTGGSGPLGFYVSFLFIAISYLVSFVAAIVGLIRKEWRFGAILIILCVGLAYNGVFAEEYLFGRLNGSAPQALKEAVAFIAANDSIRQVISYNDIGTRELSNIGKYAGRFYAAPDFEDQHQRKFAAFDGQYLVVDIPHLYENGFYGQFFSKCHPIFETASGRIVAHVYECPKGAALPDSL